MTTKQDVPRSRQEPFPHDGKEFVDYDYLESENPPRSRKPAWAAIIVMILGFAGLLALFLFRK